VITEVAFTKLHVMRSIITVIRRERPAYVDGFLEATAIITTDTALVGSGIDEFSLKHFGLLSVRMRNA
jgi:hypothetical protein